MLMQNKSHNLVKNIRHQALNMVHRANSSHIGSCLSIADILAVLYENILQFDPLNLKLPQRDRFILSKGHSAAILYATLAEKGFFSKEQLETYGKDFSNLMNHISHKVPGVEFSTGSLGHGLPVATGKALAAKTKKEDWRTFVLVSDGEMGEGSNWEALMFAAHHKLHRLTVVIDYNKLQSLGTVENTLNLEPLEKKLTAFGMDVIEVDGHNHKELREAFTRESIKPKVVIAHTIKGKGVSFMENKFEWHYKSPNAEELVQALIEVEQDNHHA